MARVRLELDKAGIRKFLRTDDDLADMVDEAAGWVQQTAEADAGNGAEFSRMRFIGRDRMRVHVGTANLAAMQAEARDRVLMRALRVRGGS